ncbi:MAG: hypothetical protein ABIR98_16170 [Usitatibacter sp.]
MRFAHMSGEPFKSTTGCDMLVGSTAYRRDPEARLASGQSSRKLETNLKMPGIPFAKRYKSPVGAAKGTPPRTKAALASRDMVTEKAADPAKRRAKS